MFNLTVETADDWWEVENLYDLAFGPGRGGLSSYRLREAIKPVEKLCLVARDTDLNFAGAIRYWPIQIEASLRKFLLLGPIAVHPTRQGEGLGAMLMNNSLQRAKKSGWDGVILIGDYPYYRRFGFEKVNNLYFPPPTNPDRLLVKSLSEEGFSGVAGKITAISSVASK